MLDPRLRYRFFSLFKHLDLDYQVLIFFYFPLFVAAHTRSHLQRVGFIAKAAVESGSLERDDRGGGG